MQKYNINIKQLFTTSLILAISPLLTNCDSDDSSTVTTAKEKATTAEEEEKLEAVSPGDITEINRTYVGLLAYDRSEYQLDSSANEYYISYSLMRVNLVD